MKRCVLVIVSGKVQGVNFRRYTQATAQKLGVYGWVRNLPSGSVEGCFEGDAGAVNSLLEWCRSGPPAGRVDNLEILEQNVFGGFTDFQIRQ